MLDLHKRVQAAGSDAEREMKQRQNAAVDRQSDALVCELYGLTRRERRRNEAEVAVVEGR